jgi:hypothetical protein
MMASEMEANISLLDDNGLGLLAGFKEAARLHKADDEGSECPRHRVAAPSPLRERSTPPAREHKIPILFKKPILQPASPKVRRLGLVILPPKRKQELDG